MLVENTQYSVSGQFSKFILGLGFQSFNLCKNGFYELKLHSCERRMGFYFSFASTSSSSSASAHSLPLLDIGLSQTSGVQYNYDVYNTGCRSTGKIVQKLHCMVPLTRTCNNMQESQRFLVQPFFSVSSRRNPLLPVTTHAWSPARLRSLPAPIQFIY